MSWRHVSVFCPALILCAACGSAPPSTHTPSASSIEPTAAVEPPPVVRREGTIARAALDEVLAQGIGRFLQRVSTEPHLDSGRFVGFRFTELQSELFASVDLRPGDTLLSINGRSLERPEEAVQIWNALRVASELTVEYLREGERHQLRFAIAD